MRLVIQIPCRDEATTLPAVLADLPRRIDGVDEIRVLVIDDGSSDGTAEVAARCGADHVVRFPANQGLARAFQAGLDAALRMGADIVVNTDGDGQYEGADVPALIAPLLAGEADVAIGDRRAGLLPWFSPTKRRLQRLGSATVRLLSGLDLPDAPSGFRALSREAALRLTVVTDFSYTLETILQMAEGRMKVASVPVRVRPPARPSRLARSTARYVLSSGITLLRVSVRYRPLRHLLPPAALLLLLGMALTARFLWFHLTQDQAGHVQSLVLAAVLLTSGLALGAAGVLADAVAANRRMLEELLRRQRRMELRALGAGERASDG